MSSEIETGLSADVEPTVRRGIRRMLGPVVARIIQEPTNYEGFRAFKAGDANTGDIERDEAVQEVQQTAAGLVTGTIVMRQTPVVLEDDSGNLIGFCSIHRRTALTPQRPWIAERYIVAFGRDVEYRKCPLRDNTTYVGETLIRAGLDMIALEAGDGPMPSVSALVKRSNSDSRRSLERFGFIWTPGSQIGHPQDLLWRERGVEPPEPLPAEVYVPPEWPEPTPKLGRNDPCPCGSGRKFKKCCGR
jgi:hypothetical protein